MKKTKAKKQVKKQVKSKAVKQSVKRIVKKHVSVERESVKYSFDDKSKAIVCESNVLNSVTNKSSQYRFTISQVHIAELTKRLNDLKSFYSYCNADVKLLKALHVDSSSKKLHECINTQYDSRKKLHALIMQLSLSKSKQKSKSRVKAISK